VHQGISLKTKSYTVRSTFTIKLATHFMHSKKLANKKQKKMDLGMACHTPPIKEVKEQGEIPLPSLGPIPSLNSLPFEAFQVLNWGA